MKVRVLDISAAKPSKLYFDDLSKHPYNETRPVEFMHYWLIKEVRAFCRKRNWTYTEYDIEVKEEQLYGE